LGNVVNSSRVLSIGALGIALALTVPLKLSDLSAFKEPLSHNLQQASAALLTRGGFEVKMGNSLGFPVIDAQQNNCRLQIRQTVAAGFNVDAIKENAPKDAWLVFEYRGKLWMSHPTVRATISEILSRLKWQLGADDSWSPVIAITAFGACAIETLPWDEVASIRAK
jgi:hypothetical protein